MFPAGLLIPWPDAFEILLPASLTHGFHTSFLGVFYLESTITLPLLPAASPVSFILRQFVGRTVDKQKDIMLSVPVENLSFSLE